MSSAAPSIESNSNPRYQNGRSRRFQTGVLWKRSVKPSQNRNASPMTAVSAASSIVTRRRARIPPTMAATMSGSIHNTYAGYQGNMYKPNSPRKPPPGPWPMGSYPMSDV